jgi:cell division FtsZ-interacting protein ZapD
MSELNLGKSTDDGWEEIPEVDSEEIDAIIASLNELMERTTSPVVLEILEDACCDLAELVDVDDDEELSEAA